jgi:hypothetical protein
MNAEKADHIKRYLGDVHNFIIYSSISEKALRSKEQMKMGGDQRPGVTNGLGLLKFLSQAIQGMIPIAVISKKRLAVDSPGVKMMQRSRRVDSGFARHGISIAKKKGGNG